MSLNELVYTCVLNGIHVVGGQLSPNTESHELAYEIGGFGKSGTAMLYMDGETIICQTRYDTIDEIFDFEDLCRVAYRWNINSITRGFAIDSNWLPVFEKCNFKI